MSDPQPSNILMLPAPEGAGATKLPVASDPDAPAAVVKLDELGPMVVNSDGVGAISRNELLDAEGSTVGVLVDCVADCELGEHDRDGTRTDVESPRGSEQVRASSLNRYRFFYVSSTHRGVQGTYGGTPT
jgi:hypothetical protein